MEFNVNSFIKEIDSLENKENFLEYVQNYEQNFYEQYEKKVQDQLPIELQHKTQPQSKTQIGEPTLPFLQQNPEMDKEYLQGKARFARWNSAQQENNQGKLYQRNFQEQSDQLHLNQCVNPNQNFLDVEANTKHFYPNNEGTGQFTKETNFPQNNISNAQHQFLQKAKPQGFQQTGIKDVYPRGVFQHEEIERPQFLNNSQQQDQQLREHIQKLGGIQDCIGVMEMSLRENEANAFSQKQQNFDQFQFNQTINDRGVDPVGLNQNQKNVSGAGSFLSQTQQFKPNSRSNSKGNVDQGNPFSSNPFQRLQNQNVQLQQPFSNSSNNFYPNQQQQYNTQNQSQNLEYTQQQQSQNMKQLPPRPDSGAKFINNQKNDPFKNFEQQRIQEQQSMYQQQQQRSYQQGNLMRNSGGFLANNY